MSLGSGPNTHGQLLIYHDMFGLYHKFKPNMAKVFGNAGEVKSVTFPASENWFGMPDEEFEELKKIIK
jgi:3-methyl-2-oxobutanoate hydroxymethyltransferase